MTRRVAVVTGASRGIGRAISIELARAGFDIAIAARTVDAHRSLPGTIGDTVAAVEACGVDALAVRTDLCVRADIDALVDAVVDRFGRIDVLVNNAAETSGTTPGLEHVDLDEWDRSFAVNVDAPLQLLRRAVPVMAAVGGGLVVNLTSEVADLVDHRAGVVTGGFGAQRLAYAASKAALNRLANALAPELASMRVAIINVDPGFTRTELVELLGAKGLVDPAAATSMDLPARVVRWLAETPDAARWTGSIIRAAAFAAEHDLQPIIGDTA